MTSCPRARGKAASCLAIGPQPFLPARGTLHPGACAPCARSEKEEILPQSWELGTPLPALEMVERLIVFGELGVELLSGSPAEPVGKQQGRGRACSWKMH